MRTACRLSLRWHQQFYRSPSFTGHQQCLLKFQPIREYRLATRGRRFQPSPSSTVHDSSVNFSPFTSNSGNDVVVREYEPDAIDSDGLHRVEPNQEIVDEMATTRAELMKLERELAVMRQGPFGPQSDFMKALPKDEREELLQALAQEGIMQGEQEDLLTMADLETLAEDDEETARSQKELSVTLRIPKRDQAYVRHFNKALQTAEDADGRDVERNLHLWKWYLRCQQHISNFSTMISAKVWRVLWKTQAELKPRPKHLIMLANDMLQATESLSKPQWLSYMEALHADGQGQRAIDVWRQQKSEFRSDPTHVAAYWAMGIQTFAAIGQPLKAQELAFNALDQAKAEPRVLVPVILAWARSQEPDALVKAWFCYLKLREKTGTSMSSDLYECISNTFLDNNHGDMALSVFKDMLLMKEASSYDSREIYKQATRHFGEVIGNATTEEQINRVGLSALLILPRQFQNRFFFSSWVKKLIGEKRADAAAMVVELMYERGVAPDAKPLNGIIGAWLREGSPKAQRKAEAMAQSMIEARIDLVEHRKATSKSQGKLFRKVTFDDRSVSIRRQVPAATIETFSILLQYLTRRQDSRAEELTSTMIDVCEIQPNSYIMNHWLYGDLRAGRIKEVWDKFCNLRNDITPDLETFAALWDTAKVQFSKSDATHTHHFPTPRKLFAEMNDWLVGLALNTARKQREGFSAELYEQVVRCFCLSTDLPGTLLAIHHMSRVFDIYPTDNALRLICGQAARLLPQDRRLDTRSARSRRSAARYKPAMSQIADIIETIETKRKIAAVEGGADPQAVEDPKTEIAQRLRLDVLTEFICMFMQKAQAQTGSYRNDLKIAAQAMHVDLDGIEMDLVN